MRRLGCFACTLTLLLPSVVYAQSLDIATACGKAISGFSFTNSYDLLTESQQFNEYQSRLCQLQREDYKSFSSSASSAGFDMSVADTTIGFSDSDKNSSGMFRSKLNHFCASNFATYDRADDFKQSIRKVSSDLANFMKYCVKVQGHVLSQETGAFVTIEPEGGFENFVANLVVKNQGQTGSVLVNTIAPEKMVKCWYRGVEITRGTKLDSYSAPLSCTKDPTREIHLVISTNLGTSQSALVPAQQDRLQEIADQVTALTASLDKMRNSPPAGVSVLAADGQDGGDSVFTRTITVDRRAILLISASGEWVYLRKDNGNAGVTTSITVNGKPCGRDFSFEGTSSTISFYATASCVYEMVPGSYTVKIAADPIPKFDPAKDSQPPRLWTHFAVLARDNGSINAGQQ
jgi:hypothetical protein